MKSEDASIDLEIMRPMEEIVDELFSYRQEASFKENIDVPRRWSASVYANAEDPQYAFNKAFADSNISLLPGPETYDPAESTRLLDLVVDNENEADIHAQADNQAEHVQAVTRGVDALEYAGFDTEVELEAFYEGDSIEDTLRGLTNSGLRASLSIYHNDEQGRDDTLYTKALYHSDTQEFEPEVGPAGPEAESQTLVNAETEIAEALEKRGLLR